MTVLVFGKTGQVATALVAQGGVICLDRDQADLGDPDACADRIARSDATAVINAAAYTAVDRAEKEEALATTINGTAPGAMAHAAAAKGIPFVHISTDYVFDGSGDSPRCPGDTPEPLGAYGRSKLAGEEAVRAAGGTYAILRTAWVFSAYGTNFLKTMLRLSETRDHLTIVDDQVGGPTPAPEIARACMTIAGILISEPGKAGIYHLSGTPEVSWAGFAREIFAAAKRDVRVENITSSAYPSAVRRPLNSRLDCSSLRQNFGIDQPDWRAATRRIVESLT